jgi:hypothetical protein
VGTQQEFQGFPYYFARHCSNMPVSMQAFVDAFFGGMARHGMAAFFYIF